MIKELQKFNEVVSEYLDDQISIRKDIIKSQKNILAFLTDNNHSHPNPDLEYESVRDLEDLENMEKQEYMDMVQDQEYRWGEPR